MTAKNIPFVIGEVCNYLFSNSEPKDTALSRQGPSGEPGLTNIPYKTTPSSFRNGPTGSAGHLDQYNFPGSCDQTLQPWLLGDMVVWMHMVVKIYHLVVLATPNHSMPHQEIHSMPHQQIVNCVTVILHALKVHHHTLLQVRQQEALQQLTLNQCTLIDYTSGHMIVLI